MSFKQKYKRLGSFVIDIAIVQMFAMIAKDIYLGVLSYASQGTGVTVSFHDAIALPVLLLIIIGVMLITIGVYMGYHWLCYRLLGNSFSRYFLRLSVESVTDEPMTQSRYLKREFQKIYLSVASLGLYVLYSGAQYLTHSNQPWHDKKFATKVVEY
ncbi:RDD family protein [Vibrio sp. S17_S38]|uniref:RDD family protein n=1 Tax=Vibrio sp. S17_S38 TaxID=2720229 RepID=UPI001681A25E|nr:RDD family protein [Vibrio sp. S17_S38]MBD1571736.1 RDD family protein [Vibrio sp. S17_S38]